MLGFYPPWFLISNGKILRCSKFHRQKLLVYDRHKYKGVQPAHHMRIVSNRNTGYFDAIFSNSEIGASLLTDTCGRAPGASCKYAFKIGALWLISTSCKKTCSLIPCRSRALPPAAWIFRTQFVSAPNMDTRYLSPFITVIASGKLVIFPDFLPTTSKVTSQLGNIPSEWIIAQPLFNTLANRFGRPSRYIHLLKAMFSPFIRKAHG